MNAPNSPSDARPVFAMIARDGRDSRLAEIVPALAGRIEEAGGRLVRFHVGEEGGRVPSAWEPDGLWNLAKSSRFDGICLMPSSLEGLDDLDAERVVRSLGVPCVSYGRALSCCASVVVDVLAAVEEIAEHFVGRHGCRNLLILRQPGEFPALPVFQRVLARYGEGRVEELAIRPDDLAAVLERRRDKGIDGLLASSDDLALRCLELLKAWEIAVPGEVRVCGVGDGERGRLGHPALTSMHVPLGEMARVAADQLVALFRGEEVPSPVELGMNLVSRGSCGCRSLAEEEALFPPRLLVAQPHPAGCAEHGEQIRRALRSLRLPPLEGNACRALAQALAEDVVDQDSARTFALLEAHLREPRPDEESWALALARVRRVSLPFFLTDPADVIALEGIFHQLREVLQDAAQRRADRSRVDQEAWAGRLQESTGRLALSFGDERMAAALAEVLPSLEIGICQIVHRRPDHPAPLRWVHDYRRGVFRPQPFDGSEVVRSRFLRDLMDGPGAAGTLQVEGLRFEGALIGWLVFEMERPNRLVAESLRTQVAIALAGAGLARENEERALALEGAFQNLQAQQKQLVNSERMASLGRLVSAAAEDVGDAFEAALAEAVSLEARMAANEVPPDVEELRRRLGSLREVSEAVAGYIRSIRSKAV